MTTLAAIEGDGWAVFASDSQSSDESGFVAMMPGGKAFDNQGIIVAGAGQVRGINLLEHAFVAPTVNMKYPDKYITNTFIPAMRKCFLDAGYEYKREDTSVENDNIWLVGVRGHVYRIEEDYSWERNSNGIYVAGSGERFALGALEAMKADKAKNVTEAKMYLKKAIQIAIKYDAFSGGEVKFLVST